MTESANTPAPGGTAAAPPTIPPSPAGPGGPVTPATTTGAGDDPGRPRRRGGLGRVLKWAFLLILLLLIGGGIFLWLNLNRIVKHTVETQSTAQLNLKTELDGAAVSLF